MRKLSILLAIIPLMLAAAPAQDGVTIGLVTINLEAAFFNQVNDGAQGAADAAEAELIIVDGRNSAEVQVAAIENFIQQDVDAIIVLAFDSQALLPVLQEAADAEISVLSVDAIIDSPLVATNIGTDNSGAGVEIGEFTANLINEQLGGTAVVGVIGAFNSFIQGLRQEGFESALTGLEGVTFVPAVDGQNVQEVAFAAGENLVTANPDLTVVHATGEPALLGAIAAIESQGVTDRVFITGWDLTPSAIRGIREGFVAGVVQQDPEGEGRIAVESALTLINGGTVESRIPVPITIVTQENVDQFDTGS